MTQSVGSEAKFRCRHQSTDAIIIWRVNGSSASEFPGAVAVTVFNEGNLTIPAIPENDGIEVVCLALFTDGRLPEENSSSDTYCNSYSRLVLSRLKTFKSLE